MNPRDTANAKSPLSHDIRNLTSSDTPYSRSSVSVLRPAA